ncbi:hypothetical protein [Mucilaginibacter sp. 22184]|uniref:hypothetical protein n=1 Tax=Mucilaginibacter sp. 22184 TaxID=3453887 RepID=UPI003F858BDC
MSTLNAYLSNDAEGLVKNGLPPVYGTPVCLVSAASPPYTLNAINISNGGTSQDSPLILWALAPGPTDWNSSWQLTPDGFIVNPFLFNMVIGISGSTLCIVTKDDTDQTQQWAITWYAGGYTISNNQNQQLITAASNQVPYVGGADPSNTLSLTALNNSPSPEQLWKFLPAGYQQTINQFYIQTQCSGTPPGGSSPYMLAANWQNNQLLACTQQWQPGASNQLWQFNYDGSVSPLSNSTWVLTSNASSATDTSTQTDVVTPPATLSAQQIWTWSHEQLILSSQEFGTQMVLTVKNAKASENAWVVTYEINQGSNEKWTRFPLESAPIGEWFYIQTELNQSSSSTPPGPEYVLTVAGSSPVASTLVQINQLQPGALSQLWQFTPEGTLINILNPSLLLSADPTTGNSISLQAAGDAGVLQTWCLLPNGMFAVANGTTVQYLSVLNSISATSSNPGMANGEVTTYTYPGSNNANASWKIVNYEPEMSGQWFTIQSATEQKNNRIPFLLTVSNDWATVQTAPPLGGNILANGEAAVNQLWQFTLDGNIVSALNSGLFLTGNQDGTLSLTPGQTGNPNQQWVWGDTWKMFIIHNSKYHFQSAVLLNVGQQLALYAQLNQGNSGTISSVSLKTAVSPASNVPGQCWFMAPFNPAYNQPTTFRNTGGTEKEPGLFLQLEEGATKNSYNVVVGARGNAALSTWQFVYPGYIASSLNDNIVLSVEATEGANDWTPDFGPNVTAYLRAPGAQPFQLWVADPSGMLVNKQTGFALTVTTDGTTYSLTTQPVSDQPDASMQLWDFSPGQALQTVLVMPRVPFPVPDDSSSQDLTNVYNEINKTLGLPGGIRAQYQNLAAPLGTYLSVINMLFLKNSQSQDWKTVVEQLNKEIISVTAIQQFFTQAGIMHQSLSQAQALLVSELITACAFPNGQNQPVTPPKKKKKFIWDIVEGVLYTALNAAGALVGDPDVVGELKAGEKFLKHLLPVLANVMSASVTCYQARPSAQPTSKTQAVLQNIYNYELSVFQLQQSLLSLFENIGTMLGKMEMAILSDWGKTTAVYDMIKNTDTIDSLYWPASLTPVMTNQMLDGYAGKVFQTLIPSNPSFYINAYLHNSTGPERGLQEDQLTFYGENIDGTFSEWVAVINPDVMNLLWSYGTNPNDFYRQLNGWDVQVKYPFTTTNNTASPSSATITITIFNITSVPMLLDTGGMEMVINAGTSEIPPYGAQQFAGYVNYNGGVAESANGNFQVVEKNGGDTILSGNLAVKSTKSNNPVNPGDQFTVTTINAPYYIMKQTQNPQYIANMLSIEVYIAAAPGVGDNS